MVYLSSANAANDNADVHGWAWRAVKQNGSITLGFHERMMYGDSLTPGAALYLSADNTKKGRLDTAPGAGSPYPCAFVMEDGQRIYCLQNVGLYTVGGMTAEESAFFGAVPQAAEPNIGATTGIAVNDVSATLVATKAELDTTNTKVNNLLAKLRTAGIIAP
jgi:hypothetical protein